MYNDETCECGPCTTLREKDFWYANCEYETELFEEKDSSNLAWDDEDD